VTELTARVRTALATRVGLVHDLGELIVLYALEQSGRSRLLTEEERVRVDANRAQLRAALADLEAGGDILARIGADAAAIEADLSARFRGTFHVKEIVDSEPVRPSRSGRIVGSVVAVAAAAALLFVVLSGDGSKTLHTESDAEARITFRDGSTVKILPASTVRYRVNEAGVRPVKVELDGAAYFNVASADVPLVVETSTARIVVLGTEFGVRAEAQTSEIVVVTGRVTVAGANSPNRSVVLMPGQATRVDAGAEPVSPYPVDAAESLDWAELFLFQGTPLPAIAERLASHYGVGIEIEEGLQGEALTATFDRTSDLADVLSVVCAAVGCTVSQSPDGYSLLTQ
jgi:ferric-dicitrate binding protein FerR (iron transport regulator)